MRISVLHLSFAQDRVQHFLNALITKELDVEVDEPVVPQVFGCAGCNPRKLGKLMGRLAVFPERLVVFDHDRVDQRERWMMFF